MITVVGDIINEVDEGRESCNGSACGGKRAEGKDERDGLDEGEAGLATFG